MRYRRALVLAEPGSRPEPALSALRSVAPALDRVVVVVELRGLEALWSSDAGAEAAPQDLGALEAWRVAVSAFVRSVEVRYAPDLPVHALVGLALAEDVDLLVAGGASFGVAELVQGAARRLGVALLWPAGEPRTAPAARVFCAALGRRSYAAIAAFLRDHGNPSLDVSVVAPGEPTTGELAAALKIIGIRATVEVIPHLALSLRGALDAATRRDPVNLLVLARVPTLLLLALAWPAPVLVVPPAAPTSPSRAFDITDAVEVGDVIRARVDEVNAVGSLTAAGDVALAFVCEGRVVATAITSPYGDVELPASVDAAWLGAVRVVDDAPPDPLAAVEQLLAVLRPGGRDVVLFDATLSEAGLAIVRASPLAPLAVRLRPTIRASVLRERLRGAGLPAHVVDARAVLDEGDAFDVGEANDPVRLRRVAARMRRAGYRVASVVDRTLERAEALADTPVTSIEGNRVVVELDNAQARAWLVGAIADARRSVSVQVYMASDDEVGRAIEAALADAAARGVTTRVLVDSLHGLHGSFGAENPLLVRLAAHPGIELRVSRPLTTVPSMADLKQRDHRKIVVVDDRVALVGGRNFAHEYYTGFDEARIDAATPWRQVPWLDAGARIEGPAVAAIAASFRDAWIEAGGASFPIDVPGPVGTTAARVVVHRGLRDARTLEAYLELIEGARSHVIAVNGFPCVLELQHALLGALRRGVRVRALTGHVTPMHEATPFGGAWSSARATATEFAHSRLDPIVEAGGEVYLLAQHGGRLWAPDLGVVYPHVHAKLMSIDGRRCAVGSANFDVTSSYWESELMIVVEDAAVVTPLEARLDTLLAGSTRVSADDEAWRERARRRSWMRRWPGALGA